MELSPAPTLAELAALVGGTPHGPAGLRITGLNEIHRVAPGDVTFCDVAKYLPKALASPAAAVLVTPELAADFNANGTALVEVPDPFSAFNRLALHYRPEVLVISGNDNQRIAEGVQFGRGVQLGSNVVIETGVEIGHNVVLGDEVYIGAHTRIYANVTLYARTRVGQRCIIHSGSVLGTDAFYYKRRPDGRRERLYSCGRVELADDVEIGSGVTIDRGVTAVTRIGRGTKIDNLVQIGHDVEIGADCILAAQVGIAGAARLGDRVTLWAKSGVGQGLSIGNDAQLGALAATMRDIPPGEYWLGQPAMPARKQFRVWAWLNKQVGV